MTQCSRVLILGEPAPQTPQLHAMPCCCGSGLSPQRGYPANGLPTLVSMRLCQDDGWGAFSALARGLGARERLSAQSTDMAYEGLALSCLQSKVLSELHSHSHCRSDVPSVGRRWAPWISCGQQETREAPACSLLRLPVSTPSQKTAPHPPRCSDQEPGRHFHSFRSTTLSHPPASPAGSTSREA